MPEAPEITPTPVEFFCWGQGIAGDLYRPPTGSDAPRPGMVLCNGLRGVKEWILPPFARIFAAAGFTALVFDHRGLGASEGERGRINPRDQIDDVRAAITYLSGLPEVDPHRIVLWGPSLGGANAIAAAAADDRAAAVVAVVTFGDLDRTFRATLPARSYEALVADCAEDRAEQVISGKSRRVPPDRLLDNEESRRAKADAEVTAPEMTIPLNAVERLLEYRPERVVGYVAPAPLLIIGSTTDTVIPFQETESLFARAGQPKRLEAVRLGHYEMLESPGREQVAELCLDFLRPIVLPEESSS
jgi:hypothetical protein